MEGGDRGRYPSNPHRAWGGGVCRQPCPAWICRRCGGKRFTITSSLGYTCQLPRLSEEGSLNILSRCRCLFGLRWITEAGRGRSAGNSYSYSYDAFTEGRFYITAGIGFTHEADSEYRIRLYIFRGFQADVFRTLQHLLLLKNHFDLAFFFFPFRVGRDHISVCISVRRFHSLCLSANCYRFQRDLLETKRKRSD